MNDAGASKYAEEQEALVAGLEQGQQDEIRIQAPRDPEVNPEVYRDVEPVVFRGFLTTAAEVNGVTFVFKSINQHEMELLRLMTPAGRASSKFWNQFLAYGVFMVDGVNILPERERWMPKVARTFQDFSPASRQRIIRAISELNRRAANATQITECYVTERFSRYRWYQLQGMDMTATAVTGIPGTERLGLNWAQLVWRALNRIEDIREHHDHAWENAKFVGGCMAGKGISKLYHQDNERRRKEKEEQNARKDKLLREVLLGEKFLSDKEAGGAQVIVARTVEELASQLERDLRGEKDWHDLVVDEYNKRIRQEHQSRQTKLQEMATTREAEFGGKALFGGTEVAGLTAAEVHERMLRQRYTEAQSAAAHSQWPELHDPKLASAIERHHLTDPEAAPVYPVPPPRRGGTPFRR